jgi:hypothetical protein
MQSKIVQRYFVKQALAATQRGVQGFAGAQRAGFMTLNVNEYLMTKLAPIGAE